MIQAIKFQYFRFREILSDLKAGYLKSVIIMSLLTNLAMTLYMDSERNPTLSNSTLIKRIPVTFFYNFQTTEQEYNQGIK